MDSDETRRIREIIESVGGDLVVRAYFKDGPWTGEVHLEMNAWGRISYTVWPSAPGERVRIAYYNRTDEIVWDGDKPCWVYRVAK